MTIKLHEGDSLEVMRGMATGTVDAVVTDPPYLMGSASSRKSADKAMGWADISNASVWYSTWFSEVWRLLKPAGCFWLFGNWRSLPVIQCAASRVAGMGILSVLVWDKQWPSVGSTRGLRQNYEIVVLMGKPDFAIVSRSIGDIWQEKWAGHKPTGHPAEKPVALIRRMLEVSGVPTEGLVLDPFMGSGSTGVACILTGRDFVGIELEHAYCEMARARLHALQDRERQVALFAG